MGTTLRAIASDAGMQPNAVLYYFDSLNGVIRDLVRVVTDEFVARIEADVAAQEPASDRMLSAAIRAGLTDGVDDDLSAILYEFWPMSLHDPEINAVNRVLSDRQIEIYKHILDAGSAKRIFRPTLPTGELAELLVGLEDGLVMSILAEGRDPSRVFNSVRRTAELLVQAPLPTLD